MAGVRDVAKAGTAIHFGEGLSICSGCSNRLRRSFRHATHVVTSSCALVSSLQGAVQGRGRSLSRPPRAPTYGGIACEEYEEEYGGASS